MADETYEFSTSENNDNFTINGDDSTFQQQPQESVQYEQSAEPEMMAPGTEEDLNGASEFHEQNAAPPQEEEESHPELETEATEQTQQSSEPSSTGEHQDGPRPRSDGDREKKLFVGGLTWDTTAAQVREHFEQYGEIENVDLRMDENGHSRCFAFVQFFDTSIIEKVIKIGEHKINGKSVDPKPANPRGGGRRREMDDEPMKKVFVGGVGPELDDETIRAHFGQYGEVDGVERPRTTGPGQKKKYLFVTFFDEEAAKRSIVANKQDIGGTLCDVNKATPKQDFNRPPYGDRPPWDQFGGPRGRGGFHGGPRGGPPGRGGRGGFGGGYGPPPYGGGYDHGYGYDANYGYDPSYYGYDPNYYAGYDPNYYANYDPNYYQNYGGYDWSQYYGQGYDYSGYYGQGPPGAAPPVAGEAAPAYDGGKAKRGAPTGAAPGFHPYRKQ